MRLTLRTLLAYLDDTLEPAAAKEIGQRLSETPAAQDLVSRIKEVTRRRRLTAPPVAGDDVDPNTMAEYLDNLLPPETVTRLESLCLESEVHLAESAACHQILTLIGQPANVSDAARQRMYDLVHAIESIPAERRAAMRAPAERPPAPTLLGGRPLVARILTAAAVVLGAVGIGYLVWVSVNVQRRDVASAGSDGAEAHFMPGNVKQLDGEEPEPPALPPEEPAPPTSQPQPDTSTQREETDVTTEDRPVEPETPTESTSPADVSPKPDEGTPDESTAASTEADPDPSMPGESEKTESPLVEPAVVLGNYVSTSGVLLRFDEPDREWWRLNQKAAIRPNEVLLCLPSYRSMVQFPNGPMLELVGETELSFLEAAETTDAHVKLERGRMVLGTQAGGVTFQIDFLDQSWLISMKGPEMMMGMSLFPIWKPGGPFVYEATLYVPRGEIEFQTAKHAMQLGGPVQLRWNSETGLGEKEAITQSVAWLEKEEMSLLQVRASASLDSEIRFESSVVRPMIDATANDRSKETRLLGVQCLGAIGRLPMLIDAMNTLGRRDVRQAAIATLRQHMARGEAQEEALLQALYVKFNESKEHARGVLELLAGYSDADFKRLKAKDYADLIDLLSPDRDLCIRELAILNLEDLAGRPSGVNYSPDKPRDADIAGWRAALKDGRLPPKSRGKM